MPEKSAKKRLSKYLSLDQNLKAYQFMKLTSKKVAIFQLKDVAKKIAFSKVTSSN